MVIDWIRNGAPRQAGLRMRQFTPGAEGIGGFLAHHRIGAFLGSGETVRDIDDENATWTAFLARWCKVIGAGAGKTSREVRVTADAPAYQPDQWDGLFLTDGRGKLLSEVALGRRLKGHIGRYHGSYVLRCDMDRHSTVRTWWVEEFAGSSPNPPQPPRPEV